MSKISTYYQKKKMADQLAEELQQLENDEQLKKEFEVVDALKEIQSRFDVSAGHLAELLYRDNPKSVGQSLKSVVQEPQASATDATGKGNRKPRKMMRFTNPHTGEVVETRGGNQATLKAWRQQYGKDEVERWKEVLE